MREMSSPYKVVQFLQKNTFIVYLIIVISQLINSCIKTPYHSFPPHLIHFKLFLWFCFLKIYITSDLEIVTALWFSGYIARI